MRTKANFVGPCPVLIVVALLTLQVVDGPRVLASVASGAGRYVLAVSSTTGGTSPATFIAPPSPICSTISSGSANVLTDCEFNTLRDGAVFSDETTLAVNPTNPANLIAAANDHQFQTLGDHGEVVRFFPRIRSSNDGGHGWTTYPIDFRGYDVANDPSIAFDGSGTAYFSSIAHSANANPDLIVSHSTDGGRSWATPTRVAAGSGTARSAGAAQDKDVIAAWGTGNAVVAWTKYVLTPTGGYGGSPIMVSLTHDGGRSWTKAVEISGSAPFCIGVNGDDACDQGQSAQPVVTADGRVLVSFQASHTGGLNTNIDRDTLMVVEIDPTTGVRIAGPYAASLQYDGSSDYPHDFLDLPTYHDSQFVGSSAESVAVDPLNPAHIAEVWSDMRDSVLPAPVDPYLARTDADIVISDSFDYGRTWSEPMVLAAPNDQFQPSAVYDGYGRLRLGFFDRSYDPLNHLYGYTLATETGRGSGTFTRTQVSTELSNPTREDRFVSARTLDPSFPNPTPFIGDYTTIVVMPVGIAAYWTDLRNFVCYRARCGYGENTYFAVVP